MARRVRQQPTIGGPPFQSSLSHNIDASGTMMRRRAFRFNQQGKKMNITGSYFRLCRENSALRHSTDISTAIRQPVLERGSKHLMTLHRSSFHHLMKRRA
ncbi:hypothetical protein [Methylocella tundrae]|uniref:hypothetical protein n=1 Tax=Methylocella tundrae TaxID=227605 RepID=UPI00106BB47E|nr:hypothetical protein [Methylocella tundrae]WPP04401.1 hypothetical protein SIN04_18495 [Methylocella tundrae]